MDNLETIAIMFGDYSAKESSQQKGKCPTSLKMLFMTNSVNENIYFDGTHKDTRLIRVQFEIWLVNDFMKPTVQ